MNIDLYRIILSTFFYRADFFGVKPACMRDGVAVCTHTEWLQGEGLFTMTRTANLRLKNTGYFHNPEQKTTVAMKKTMLMAIA
jgi:hypothetical protein|tara:strand:- start:574 stop:822 length:249 start_codon:yes stop_codon:yes gene_type:complete